MSTRATYADLEPARGKIAEIIDGKLCLSSYFGPRPAKVHSGILAIIRRAFEDRWIILSRPQLHFPVPEHRDEDVLVPDVAGWRRERAADLSVLFDSPDDPRVRIVPSWVCEVCTELAGAPFEAKLAIYKRAGVSTVWAAVPRRKDLVIYASLEGPGGRAPSTGRVGWERSLFGPDSYGNGRVRALPFEEIELDLAELFNWGPEAEEPGGTT